MSSHPTRQRQMSCGFRLAWLLSCGLSVAVSAAQPATESSRAPAAKPKIGVNIEPTSYSSTDAMFANLFRQFSGFMESKQPLSVEGVGRTDQARAIFDINLPFLPDSTEDPATWYTLKYQGTGELVLTVFEPVEKRTYDAATKTYTQRFKYKWTGPTESWAITRYAADQVDTNGIALEPLHNLRLLFPGCDDTTLFTKQFLDTLKPYSVLRHTCFDNVNAWGSEAPLCAAPCGVTPMEGRWAAVSETSKTYNDRSYVSGKEPNMLQANGQPFGQLTCVACKAPCEIVYDIPAGWRGIFKCQPNVSTEAGPAGSGSVVFEVWGFTTADGWKCLWKSAVCHTGEDRHFIGVRLENVAKIKLVVKHAGDGDGSKDYVYWGYPFFWKDTEWSDRVLPDNYFTWNRTHKPWETMVDMCNAVNEDIWIGLPVSATDDFCHQLARMIRDRLHGDRQVYVELSNEVWNYGFTAYDYACRRGELSTPPLAWWEWYAKRAKEVSAIFRQEFDTQAKRVIRVYGAQYGWVRSEGLDYIQKTYGPPSDYFDCYAIAPYYRWSEDLKLTEKTTMDDLFDNCRDTLNAPTLETPRANKALADKYKLQLICYEGGEDDSLFPMTVTEALKNVVYGKHIDQRTGFLYDDYLNNWKTLTGGTLFMQFHHCAYDGCHYWGNWGALEHTRQPGSAKYDGLLRYASMTGDVNGDGKVDQTDFDLLRANYGKKEQCYRQGDLNGDNEVGFADYLILKPHLTGVAAADLAQFEAGHHQPYFLNLPLNAKTWKNNKRVITLLGSDNVAKKLSFVLPPEKAPHHGTLELNYPYVTYTPERDYVGNDTFYIRVTDGTANSNPARVQMTVEKTGDPSLVVNYHFNQSTGVTATDSSGYDNHGTLVNGPTWSAAGKEQQGLAFTYTRDDKNVAIPQYLRIPASITTDKPLGRSSYSLSVWLKPEEVPTVIPGNGSTDAAAIITKHAWCSIGGLVFVRESKDDDTHGHYEIRHNTAKKGDWGAQLIAKSAPVTTGEWHHVAGTVDEEAGTVKMYIDGQEQPNSGLWTAADGTLPMTSFNCWVTRDIFIGAGEPDPKETIYKWRWPFKGAMDEIRIYSRALSAAEVRSLYKGIRTIAPIVSIQSPAADSVVSGSADITLRADAVDPDGDVVKVEFFSGEKKIGEALAAPFTFAWGKVPAGKYVLTARATDNDGSTAVSLPVDITVKK